MWKEEIQYELTRTRLERFENSHGVRDDLEFGFDRDQRWLRTLTLSISHFW